MKRLDFFLAAASFLSVFAVWPAQAGVFTVNVFNDINLDADGCDPIDIGDCSLREAVLAANRDLSGNSIIQLAAGTYTLSIPVANEDEAFTGDLDFVFPFDEENMTIVSNTIVVQGAGADQTIIDAGALGDDRAFHIVAETDEDVFLNVTFNDLTITGGNSDGGAINAEATSGNGSSLTLNRVHIFNNNLQNNSTLGGGLKATDLGGVNITSSTISGNGSGGQGGGLFFTGLSGGSIRSSTISGNVAQDGAGAYINGPVFDEQNPVSTLFVIYNSTISANDANRGNGGIVISNTVDLQLSNTIIAGNTAIVAAPDCNLASTGTVITNGYNLIGDSSGCEFPAPAEGDQLDVAAALEPLAGNGGPTPTHAVSVDSPAYNTGNPNDCANGLSDGPEFDQRGRSRVSDGRCEIGAYELIVNDLSLTKDVDLANALVGDTLTYTIVVENNGTELDPEVVVTDTLPAGLSFVSAVTDDPADECAAAVGVVTCQLGQLDAGDSTTITLKVSAATAGLQVNNAEVSGSNADTNLDNNSDSAQTQVGAVPPGGNLATLQGGGCAFNSASGGSASAGAGGVLLGVTAALLRLRRRD